MREHDARPAAEGLIEGRNAVTEALRAGTAIDKLYIAKGETDRTLARIASKAREAGVVVVEADRRKLDAMSSTHSHQGVIAAAAAVDVEGVSCLGNGVGRDLADPANRKALTRGVRLWVEDERVSVDLPILVRYGYVVTDVARAVQDAVFSAVENTSGLEVAQVNVTVVGVSFQK